MSSSDGRPLDLWRALWLEQAPLLAAHNVDEVLIVDPATRKVDWLALTDGEYRPIERGGLIELNRTFRRPPRPLQPRSHTPDRPQQ